MNIKQLFLALLFVPGIALATTPAAHIVSPCKDGSQLASIIPEGDIAVINLMGNCLKANENALTAFKMYYPKIDDLNYLEKIELILRIARDEGAFTTGDYRGHMWDLIHESFTEGSSEMLHLMASMFAPLSAAKQRLKINSAFHWRKAKDGKRDVAETKGQQMVREGKIDGRKLGILLLHSVNANPKSEVSFTTMELFRAIKRNAIIHAQLRSFIEEQPNQLRMARTKIIDALAAYNVIADLSHIVADYALISIPHDVAETALTIPENDDEDEELE